MTVGELKSYLDDFGDHVGVIAEDSNGDRYIITLSHGSMQGGVPCVIVEIGEPDDEL